MNQVCRSIFKIKGIEYSQEKLDSLFDQKKKWSKNKPSDIVAQKIGNINREIDEMLFLLEIVSVVIVNKSHYKKLIDNFYINGERFVRLLAGSGNIRHDTIIFCQQKIKDSLVYLLDAGRNKDVPLTPSKFSAYFALANSATHTVSYPKFTVIPDCEVERITKVDWVYEKDNSDEVDIEERDVPIKFNLFDGEGLVSVEQSQKWSEELETGYLPSCYTIRGPFTKGLLVTFDIHDFCSHNNLYVATDVWGKKVDIRDIEVIFTASQVKLWASYKSCDDFVDKCKERELEYGISRVSPKEEKNYVRSNYQFLQVLKLDNEQIKKLCQPTIDHLSDISGMDRDKMLLYYTSDCDFLDSPLDYMSDPLIKALMLDERMRFDPYLRQHIYNSLNKKIKEAYEGSLYLPGNYQTMISDPYALAEHALGLEPKGLLKDKQHYSDYWNKHNINKVVACRAPLTYVSEVNILNLQNNDDCNYWYKYIQSGIIYNCHGCDVLISADSDFDSDIVFTSSSQEMIDGAQGGLPISYTKKLAPKINVTDDSLIASDINGMHSKIGFITNLSSTTYCLLEGLDKESLESKELQKRSKLYRYFQGENIDKAKNGFAKEVPKYWYQWKKIDKDQDNVDEIKFNNSIIIEKRPLYFRHVYQHYNKRYLRHLEVYDNYCMTKFGISIDDLLKKDKSSMNEQMLEILDEYYRYSFFLYNKSTMNRICLHMEEGIKEYRYNFKQNIFDYNILMNSSHSSEKKMKMNELRDEYSQYKTKMVKHNLDQNDCENISIFSNYIKNKAISEISNNVQELASLAVYSTYGMDRGSKEFAWKCFGEGIVDNLIENTKDKRVYIPIADDNGTIDYLWKKYSIKEFSIEKVEEDEFIQ
jgi:hypothetical protein